ncbi:MAG TPA: sugar phosphate nucleotidyltransferase [Candidatus Limnocylindrales bacterium]|nr:sugar phosphate nucleotidyltransferase [Candidatus Limnocylindrales bacterium]
MARHVVILAGGSGTRLWPRSRERTPKHLLTLHGKQSLLQATEERVRRLSPNVYVITEQSQVDSIREQLPRLDPDRIIIEPARRGTASALALAAWVIGRTDPTGTMISVHADHYLGPDEEAYLRTLETEADWAERAGTLVTVGLAPPYPSSGFGYIKVGEPAAIGAGGLAYRVQAFVEKPTLETARAYVREGGYFWHLGLFGWRLDVLSTELRTHTPALVEGIARYGAAMERGDREAAAQAYLALPPDAIDYALLEKTHNLLMVPAQFEWHDIGSWADLHDILEQDEAGNVVDGEAVLIDSKDCMIHAPGKLVAAVGLENMVVIETDDAILICPKARSQDVKLIVERLKQTGKTEYL